VRRPHFPHWARTWAARIALVSAGALACYALVGDALDRVYQEARSQTDEEHFKLMRGPAVLIETELRKQPPQRWPELLAALQPHFDYELRVRPLADIKFMPNERLRVLRGEIARGDEEQVDSVHYRIGGTDSALVMGPIWATPVKNDYLNFMSVRVLATVALMTLLAFPLLVVWAWFAPARRDVRALRATLRSLAQGGFAAPPMRVESRLLTPLSEEIARLALELQGLVDSQRELSRAVSHELRTPVARLRFGLALLDEHARSGNERVIAAMERSLTDLEDLVECSLTYARYTQTRPILNLDERPLMGWVSDELAPLAASSAQPALVLHEAAQPGVEAMFDPSHMKFALRNLVANALRFAASRVEVRVACADGWARIDVDDDGPGVCESDRARIFEPFVRGRQLADKPSEGHGLGLSIARRIVDWHGGRIELARSACKGARFSIVWPLEPLPDAGTPPSRTDTNRDQTQTHSARLAG